MARTADRKNRKRAQYLALLAQIDHERFVREWQKRVRSWHADIWKRAGKLRDGNGKQVVAAFAAVDAAREALADCKSQPALAVGSEAICALADEATKALALQIDPRLHHLVQEREKV